MLKLVFTSCLILDAVGAVSTWFLWLDTEEITFLLTCALFSVCFVIFFLYLTARSRPG